MEENSIDGIIDQLDFHLMYYDWVTEHSPSPRELNNYNKMNKQQQQEYLKEITNENNTYR
jgi:hypothetical protein